MGILPIILLCFSISEISALYSIKQIEGINDQLVTNVNFDRLGNTYVVATPTGNTDFRLYKLNPSDEILSSTDLPDFVYETLISKEGDTYYRISHDDSTDTVGIVRANTTQFEVIDVMKYSLFHLDNDGNLFYCREKGVYVLRHGSSDPILITNLEDSVSAFSGIAISDQSGNTFIPVLNSKGLALVVITKEALQEEKPYATFINPLENSSNYIQDLMIDKDDNLWASSMDRNLNGVVKRLVKENWETVITETDRPFHTMMQAKEKTYVIASDVNYAGSEIYYIASNDDVVEIPELKNLTTSNLFIQGIGDTEGQVYFFSPYSYELSSSLGRMITIQPDHLQPIPIAFGNYTGSVTELEAKLDFNNDVWIRDSYENVYHLKKGEIVPDSLINPNEICYDYFHIDINFVTEKIYVSCSNGLFIATDSLDQL